MMLPRFFVAAPLAADTDLLLPPASVRHLQVRRLQPGQTIVLFDGRGGQWPATITKMGRKEVAVTVGAHEAIEREAPLRVHLAVGLFAFDRMDWLAEKATELGATSLTPVHMARSNLPLAGALKKQARWQAIAARACEQCGRNRLLDMLTPCSWSDFLQQTTTPARWLLSPHPAAPSVAQQAAALTRDQELVILSGPEGGLSSEEEAVAIACGFQPVGLGPRILRAETAPLAALAALLLH